MKKQELTYWVTLALIPKMWTRRKNEIYVNCFNHSPQLSIIDLFEETDRWQELGLSDEEITMFTEARTQLAQNSFLVEEMKAQGYEIIPLHSDEYPVTLKKNLGTGAPTVIYIKGNKNLLQEKSIAIVGSRNADSVSLTFTDNIAKKATTENKVVVSGFAKGVDRQALDSSVESGGKSIIVLPQGIMTFASGFKQYYKAITQGRVLVMSTFAPNAPWSVEFAMARNPIIYGMANDIYVAQSDDKGGTWAGVIDGLRKKRTILVRWPNENEKNANKILVQKGAAAVDIHGALLCLNEQDKKTPEQIQQEEINKKIHEILNAVERITAKELISRLQVEWKDDKMKRHLESLPEIEKFKEKNRIYFRQKGKVTPNIFSMVHD